MKCFVISGTAFYAFRGKLMRELPHVIERVTAQTTVLDYKTIDSILGSPIQHAPLQSEFLLISLTGVLQEDVQAVMEQIVFNRGKPAVHLVLNCTLVSPDVAAGLVKNIQYSMSMMAGNVLSFSFVCNDAEILEYAGMLSHFFRGARLGHSREQLKKDYRRMLRYARYIRYIAWNPLLRFAVKMYQKIRSRLKK